MYDIGAGRVLYTHGVKKQQPTRVYNNNNNAVLDYIAAFTKDVTNRKRISCPGDEKPTVCTKESVQEVENSDLKNKDVIIEDRGNVKMAKQIGLPSGVAFIVGTMIGSGIFISPKGVLISTGSIGASLLVWTGCGVIAMAAALCYAELGTMIPLSGGEFSYLKECLGPIPAFLSVWTEIVITRTASQAILSLTFSQYVLAPMFDECGPPTLLLKLLAAAIILTVAVVNCYSAKIAARVQVIFTVAKLSALLVIIGGGIVKLAQGNTQHLAYGFEGSTTNPSVIALAFYSGLWAYGGWNTLNFLTEELINPSVNLPRAIFISIPLVTVIYLLTNISYFTVLSKEALLASPAVAVTWGEIVLGVVSVGIPLAVACSTFGALNSSCFTGGRICYVAGRAGHLPSILSYVHVLKLTPWCSLIFTTVMALVMVIPANIGQLINFLSFTSWLVQGTVFVGVILMRFTHKDWKRPYKVPIVMPIFMVLVSAYLIIAPILDNPQIELLYAAMFFFGGLFFYFPFVHFKIKFHCMDSFIKWIQLFLQVAPSKYEP